MPRSVPLMAGVIHTLSVVEICYVHIHRKTGHCCYPFGEFFPLEVSCDQFNCFFLSEVSGYLRVVTSFCNLS